MAKPFRTATSHRLPFQELSPLDFERLCLWLVRREGYERAEHFGEAGGEGGRDVVPNVAIRLNNLAQLLKASNRLAEAEPLMRRHLAIFLDFTRRTGHQHPHLQAAFANYRGLLKGMGKSNTEIETALSALGASPE